MDQSYTMLRAALGNIAHLGDLYDARTDRFSGISLFKKTVPETALTHTDNHFSDIQFVHSDTFGEKFSKLDVSTELQVSVLADLLKLEGSGRYLKDQKNSSRSVKSSLIYNVRTKEDTVNIYSEDLKDCFALDAIQSGVATHVVVGITWGANFVLSCEYLNTENQDVSNIKASLSTDLKKLGLSLSGKVSADFSKGGNNKDLSIRIYGDVLPRNLELPTTFEAALELTKKIPSLVATCNDGRGMPLKYKLIPLPLLKDYLKFEMTVDLMVVSVQEYILVRIVQIFEKLNKLQQQLNGIKEEATQNKFAIGSADMTKVITLVEKFFVNEAKFKEELRKMLFSVRSGKANGSALENLVDGFEAFPCSSTTIEAELTTIDYVLEKIAFAKTLVALQVKYIGYGECLYDELYKNLNTKTCILYFNEECITKNLFSWPMQKQMFLQEAKKNQEYNYIAVDCTIHESLWNGTVMNVLKSRQEYFLLLNRMFHTPTNNKT